MSPIKNTSMKIAAALAIAAISQFAGAVPLSVGMGNNGYFTDTLENKLVGQGYSVSVVNDYTSASLSAFNVYIQDGNSYFDQDALTQFVQSGGTLIELPWSLDENYSFNGALKLMNGPNGRGWGFGSNPSFHVLDASAPLLSGVTLPAAGAYTIRYEYGTTFTANAHQILSYADADGTSMLAAASVGKGEVIALNLHMITSDSSPLNAPWNDQIIYNAVNASVAQNVPEPMSLGLVGLGLASVALTRRKRKG